MPAAIAIAIACALSEPRWTLAMAQAAAQGVGHDVDARHPEK